MMLRTAINHASHLDHDRHFIVITAVDHAPNLISQAQRSLCSKLNVVAGAITQDMWESSRVFNWTMMTQKADLNRWSQT